MVVFYLAKDGGEGLKKKKQTVFPKLYKQFSNIIHKIYKNLEHSEVVRS
jgi:hypothetical protein